LKAATGEKVWRHDLLDEFKAENLRWGVAFSPLIDGDLIFTNPGGAGGHSLAAFDKRDGKLVWKALDDPAGYSSPVISTAAGVRQVLFFTGKHLVSVSPKDGQLNWQFPWETSYDCNIATPIARGDYVFISSGYDRGCALLGITKAKEGQLQVHPVYQHNRMRNHFSSSVLYKDHLYGFDDATLICMEFRTGQTRWKEKGFQKGSLLVADGHLIILGEKGKLALAAATPEQYREKASFAVSHTKCWVVPVLADGKLYVRDEKALV
jgi:outer membrane protein assembly factor BamB